MWKRERTIRPNNVSETTTKKKKTDDCIDDPPPTRRDRSRTRRRRNAGKKDARARALCGRDEIRTIIPSERERDQFKAQKCTQTRNTGGFARRKPLCVEEDAPSRRLGGFRRDNFRAGKTRALCCKHNVAACRFLLWRVSRETKVVRSVDTKERERDRERKREGKAPYLFPLISSLSLFPKP